MKEGNKKWAGTTYGSVWMHRKLIAALRFMDVRLLYIFAAVFIVPVCLLLNRSRRTSYCYLRRHIGLSPLRAAWKVYTNHCLFSQVVIDRFAMYAGKKFKVDVVGHEHYKRLESEEPAFMQFSAHIGNYELAGYTLKAEKKRLNALVFGGEKSTVMQQRNALFASDNINMIAVMPDMSHLFEINNALSANETVSMPADRIIGSPKKVTIPFMGANADFPLGPFQVATMRQLDVLAVNVMKSSTKGYTIYVTPLLYDKEAPRKERIEQLAQSYAAELERILRIYPTQWYNFYDFWNDGI